MRSHPRPNRRHQWYTQLPHEHLLLRHQSHCRWIQRERRKQHVWPNLPHSRQRNQLLTLVLGMLAVLAEVPGMLLVLVLVLNMGARVGCRHRQVLLPLPPPHCRVFPLHPGRSSLPPQRSRVERIRIGSRPPATKQWRHAWVVLGRRERTMRMKWMSLMLSWRVWTRKGSA